MKTFIKILVLLSLTKAGICQSNNSEKNNSSQLTESETRLLDSLLLNKRNTFDFKEKVVAFVTGSSANKIITKDEFFETINTSANHKIEVSLNMLILSAEEKKKSNGYDVIIISWSKVAISDKQKRKILEQLRIKSTGSHR